MIKQIIVIPSSTKTVYNLCTACKSDSLWRKLSLHSFFSFFWSPDLSSRYNQSYSLQGLGQNLLANSTCKFYWFYSTVKILGLFINITTITGKYNLKTIIRLLDISKEAIIINFFKVQPSNVRVITIVFLSCFRSDVRSLGVMSSKWNLVTTLG